MSPDTAKYSLVCKTTTVEDLWLRGRTQCRCRGSRSTGGLSVTEAHLAATNEAPSSRATATTQRPLLPQSILNSDEAGVFRGEKDESRFTPPAPFASSGPRRPGSPARGPRPLCPSPSASPRLSPRLVHARAPDGLRRTGFCPSSLSLAAAQGRTRHTLSTKGETWAWSRTTPFGGHATRRRQSRDSAEASGLPFRVPSLCHGAQRSVNPTRCKNYQGRAWARAGGRGIRTAAVGASGALLRRGRGTRESQRCSASSRGQADSRGSGTWRSGPWKALLPTEITFSISRLSLQTETSVAQPQAPVMSPFLFSLDC